MREALRDPLRLEHILDAIDRLLEWNHNDKFKNLTEKDIEYFGIVKFLEIIGEAAYKFSHDFKETHPDTPWKYIVNMRHILVHGYYQINRHDVSKTITDDLPVLRSQIISYLTEFDN